MTPPRFFPALPSALLMTVGDSIDASLTRRIARFAQWVERTLGDAVLDVIPSYTTVLVIYCTDVTDNERLSTELSLGWKEVGESGIRTDDRIVSIPVVYGDEYGEDIHAVARHTGLTVEEVMARHQEPTYTVGALGFAPGFTYLVGLPPELATPRKDRPRLRVPAGSVGIGGPQAGIYALPTSGGWNLIGRTPYPLFDRSSDDPVRLRMGDRVRFRQVPPSEWREPDNGAMDATTGDGPIEVLTPGMQTTVQDLGRIGHGSTGFAPNGAADRASLVAVNRAVGNPDNAPALEITLSGPHLRFDRRMTIALAGAPFDATINGVPFPIGRAQDVMPGDELRIGHPGRGMRAYLAVAGGIDVPFVMGSASTDLTAGLGGFRGRALRTGDRLSVRLPSRDRTPRPSQPASLADRPFRIVPGPQRDAFSETTWQTLVRKHFTVSSEANRVGIRLDGPSLGPEHGSDIISEGIVTGSIQVTGEGQAIVMLPGHATIGGYTKIATVIEDDWDRLGQLAPGDELSFVET
jgi:KipI family sensor histidine kinase inhibitor